MKNHIRIIHSALAVVLAAIFAFTFSACESSEENQDEPVDLPCTVEEVHPGKDESETTTDNELSYTVNEVYSSRDGMKIYGKLYMWIFFLFLPVPIASIVFGFYLKKKGYKYKKNVIVGIIMAALLCIYGSFTFIFSDIYSHGDEPIVNTEQMLNIDIPTHSRINTQDWTKGTQSVPRGYIYSTSDIYFDDTAVGQFEKNISNDAKWISDIPNDMVGITSYFCDIQTSDYYIIYNKDTGEFNKLPSSSGTYVFINILYNAESNTMKLVEYQIEYTK